MPDLIVSLLLTGSLLIFFGGVSLLVYRIPIIITFSGIWSESIRTGSACIRWGPGIICLNPENDGMQAVIIIRRTEIYRLPLQSNQGEEEVPADTTPAPPEVTEPKADLHRLLSFIPLIKRLIPLLFSHIKVERVTGIVKFGAGDPVTTALVYGYYHALTPLCRIFCTAVLIPIFNQLIFEADLTGGFRIVCPAGLIIRSVRKIFPDLLMLLDIQIHAFIKSGEKCV